MDTSRPDPRFPRGARTIPVQLWYPTAAREGERSLYVTDSELLDDLKAGSSKPEAVESWRSLRTHAIENVPPEKGRFPMMTFSPGFGMARAYYTSWVEELASQGFVVAVVDHPFAGETRIDGKLLTWACGPSGCGARNDLLPMSPEWTVEEVAPQVGLEPIRLRFASARCFTDAKATARPRRSSPSTRICAEASGGGQPSG